MKNKALLHLNLALLLSLLAACGSSPEPASLADETDVEAQSASLILPNQSWFQEKAGVKGQGEAYDAFGRAVATGDFNDDGYQDLAAGVYGENSAAGAVQVLYGSASGLSANADELFMQSTSSLIPGNSEAGDGFGYDLAPGDFNRDGYEDLAIGVPFEAIGSERRAGMVNVLYGSSNGLNVIGAQGFHQDTSGIEGVAEAGDRFGFALAATDLDFDGYTDLAVGAPFEAIGSVPEAGMVTVLFGGASGLSGQDSVALHQDKPNTPDEAEARDRFGYSLAAGTLESRFYGSLAVGVPLEDTRSDTDIGMVQVFTGALYLKDVFHTETINPTTQFLASPLSTYANFGHSLAIGNFDAVALGDLAVGARGAQVNAQTGAGAVYVFYDYDVYSSHTSQVAVWHQNSQDVEGRAESGDRFGESLAAGDFDGDFSTDLAVGVPGEGLGATIDTGALNLLFGSSSGLSANGNFILDQGNGSVAGSPEADDEFGFALAAGDFNGDRTDDLAVGVPSEDIGSVQNAGMVNAVYFTR